MGRKNKNNSGYVYSTNPNFSFDDEQEQEFVEPSDQLLELKFEKKGRGGKVAIVIDGFQGSDEDLKDLSKFLKNKLGVGGSAKNGQIIIQGNVRDKIKELLEQKGYKTKRVGG